MTPGLLLLALSAPAPAATVHALVSVQGDEVQLLDALTHPSDGRPAARPALRGAPQVEVRDAAGRVLSTAPVPDPRLRSIIAPPGHAGDGESAVVLDHAVARVVLDWPAGAASVALAGEARVPRAAPPGTPQAVIESGPDTERLDMVFLGDGYTADELDRFAADVDRMAASMLSIEPYGAYSDLFNVWRVDQASAESGVSHYDAGLTIDRDTAYGCYYGCGGIDRLVCCDDGRVLEEVAATVPAADGVMVLINDPTYGGAGGYQYATSYTDGRVGEQVVVHELGHSLVGLGDEYSYGAASSYPPRPNCTDTPDDPPWSAWLDEPEVSTHEVCGYTNLHRPTEDGCMMRSLRDDYCVVCREQAVLAVYGALPKLLSSVEPPTGAVTVPEQGVRFTAAVLGDAPERFEAVWLFEGAVVGSGLSLDLPGCEGMTGDLELAVQDPTDWVRHDPSGLLVDGATWSLEGCGGETWDGSDGSDGSDGADSGVPPGVTPGDGGSEPAVACGCAGAGALALPLVLLPGLARRRRRPAAGRSR